MLFFRNSIPQKEIKAKNTILIWIQQKGLQFKNFYEEVLTTTFSTIIRNSLFLANIIENIMPYFVKFILSHNKNMCLIYVMSSIPLIVSSCFVYDIIYLKTYDYFPKSVFSLIIPFFIYIIIFIYKSVTKYIDRLNEKILI